MTTSAEADGVKHNIMRMHCMYVQSANRFVRRVFLSEKHVHSTCFGFFVLSIYVAARLTEITCTKGDFSELESAKGDVRIIYRLFNGLPS